MNRHEAKPPQLDVLRGVSKVGLERLAIFLHFKTRDVNRGLKQLGYSMRVNGKAMKLIKSEFDDVGKGTKKNKNLP